MIKKTLLLYCFPILFFLTGCGKDEMSYHIIFGHEISTNIPDPHAGRRFLKNEYMSAFSNKSIGDIRLYDNDEGDGEFKFPEKGGGGLLRMNASGLESSAVIKASLVEKVYIVIIIGNDSFSKGVIVAMGEIPADKKIVIKFNVSKDGAIRVICNENIFKEWSGEKL